jgi:Undecaprenyl-phosphate galactose phosphotransferase WbaP
MSTAVLQAYTKAKSLRLARPSSRRTVLRSAVLASTDICSLGLSAIGGFWIWRLINPGIPAFHVSGLIVPLGALAMFAFSGLYPGIGLTAVQHICRYSRSVTFAYLLLTAVMVFTRAVLAESRGALFLAWVFSIVAAPVGRWGACHLLGGREWWCVPTMIIGAGETARVVIRNLQTNRILGYCPVACLDDDPRKHGLCEGVPVVGRLEDAPFLASIHNTAYAIVAVPSMARDRMLYHFRSWTQVFPSILIVSSLADMVSLWTEPRDLGGLMSLEIRQNLLNPWSQRLKRAMDIVVSAGGLLLAAPLLALLALWIRKVSPGSPFYAQKREGRCGSTLWVVKLRTMFRGAETVLEEHLAINPEARQEWDRYCKLKNDPRILPVVGRLLRRTSLDELPQLWNVLKGEMSLVGPRPFPEYHNCRFDAEFRSLRTQVTPGLTGLWQVSARSDGDLDVQMALDTYYIRNWSFWLDLYILVRTIRTVMSAEGAY